MRRDLIEIGSQFTEWLEGDGADAPAIVNELLRLPDSDVNRLGISFTQLLTTDSVNKLIQRAHWLMQRVPQDAVTVSKLAVRFAQHLPLDDDGVNAEVLAEIEADAWREHANALLNIEEYHGAEHAARKSYDLYNAVPPTSKRAILGLIAGQIVHALDPSDKGLLIVEQSANLLLSFYDLKKKYVVGRIIHAKMLIDRKRYDEAIDSYQGAADVAEELRDKELLAHILNNVGECYSRKGDLANARPCLETARELFEKLGLTADAIRPRTALVKALVANGRFNEAISEYYATRAAYLALNLSVAAARVALKIVDLLPLANRSADVPALCDEMIATFTRVGLPREAMEALAHLNAVAQTRSVQPEDVDTALAVLDRVPDIPLDDVEAGA